MKTVQYQGKTFEVPEWARFIAADDTREVYVYSEKPVYDEPSCSYWPSEAAGQGQFAIVGMLDTFPCEAIGDSDEAQAAS